MRVGKGPTILTGESTTPRPRLPGGDVYHLWQLFFVAGAVFAVVGWAEVALMWYPLHVGDAAWEFDVVGRTFVQLPLGTVGLTLISAGIIARGGSPWPIRVLAMVFAGLVVITLVCAVDYLYRLPEQWRRLAEPGRPEGAKRAIVTTLLYMISFTAAYGGVARVLWRTAYESDPMRI